MTFDTFLMSSEFINKYLSLIVKRWKRGMEKMSRKHIKSFTLSRNQDPIRQRFDRPQLRSPEFPRPSPSPTLHLKFKFV